MQLVHVQTGNENEKDLPQAYTADQPLDQATFTIFISGHYILDLGLCIVSITLLFVMESSQATTTVDKYHVILLIHIFTFFHRK